jgi:hypothetical protein
MPFKPRRCARSPNGCAKRRKIDITPVRLLQLFLVVAIVSASGAACAKARANTEPVMPELTPPPPPPRVVETFPAEPLPTIEPSPVESALATPPSPTPVRTVTKPEEAPKTEIAPPLPERPAPGAPALTLKPGPGVQAQTEASIRALLDRAAHDLQRVNYAALGADGRAQFDTARRFKEQAEDALKGANLAFASKLADKAATMAAVLVR